MKLRRPVFSLAVLSLSCLVSPSGDGRALAVSPLSTPQVGVINTIIEPMTRQVVQRRDNNVGSILVVGTYSGNVTGFQARSILRVGFSGTPVDWTDLVDVAMLDGSFFGIFRQPAGGFYDLQIRPVFGAEPGAPVPVYAVGVGEVFITAGQSNSTNWGLATGFAPDLRVSSFNPGKMLGLDPTYPGASWQYGIDPQPALDLSGGSSAWPTMATNLANALGVPIGLYSSGFTGTSIAQWQPGFVLDPATATLPEVSLFEHLTNAIEYLNFRGGVRAVLWDQGESDYGNETNPNVYEACLRNVINQSRVISGVNVKWVVAQAAYPLTDNLPERIGIELAQAAVVDNVLTFSGPDTDALGLAYRYNSPIGPLHFNAAGIVTLGNAWGIYVFNQKGIFAEGNLPSY